MRENTGVKDGTDASLDATGKAAEHRRRLDNEVGAGIGIGVSFGENSGDGGDCTKLDIGELLCPVPDDLVLDLSDSFQLDFAISGSETVEDEIGSGGGGGG